MVMTSNNENGNWNSDFENQGTQGNNSDFGSISSEVLAIVQKIKKKEEDLKNATTYFTERKAGDEDKIKEQSIRINDLEKENEELKKTVSSYEEIKTKLQQDANDLKSKHGELMEQLKQIQDKSLQQEENLQECRTSLVKSELRRNKYEEQYQKCLSDVKEYQTETSELREVKIELKCTVERLHYEIKHLQDERNGNQDTISQLKDKENQLNLENKDLKEQNDNLEQQLHQNREQQIMHKAMIDDLQKQLQTKQQGADSLHEFLANQHQSYTAKIEGLKEEIKVLRDEKLRYDAFLAECMNQNVEQDNGPDSED